MRIIDCLARHAAATPDKLFATQSDGTSVTYGAFMADVRRRASVLSDEHRPHTARMLRTSQTISYLADYFACHLADVVAVPVEHDLPAEKLAEIECMVADVTFPDEAADVLFTTGTTGAPKGVVLSHRALMADAENLAQTLGFHANLTFIINGPLNHFGSHSKVLPVVLTGGSLYVMEGMKRLDDFYCAIDQIEGHVATFLVPASIRMLVQFTADRLAANATRIEMIETGAAPITQADMRRMSELLPATRLFNTYAGSESGVVCTYNYNDGQCLQGCVGRPYPLSHIELRDGVVVCSGDGLMMGYLGQDLTSPPSEIVTSDLGRIDSEGRLFLIGRQSDIINVGGMKVSPVEVEDAAAAVIEGLKDCICIGQRHAVMGQVPKLLVVMADGVALDKKAAARGLRARLESYKMPVDIEAVGSIARTYNGKLDRKFYVNI